ncbi:MAG TPA: hypothetical protein VL117_01785 [Thermoleophilia bacterium]|nr:hypothetical protein [Thermoleophilia bacterium]
MDEFTELARLSDHDQIYEVQRALVARDIEAEVWDEAPGIKRRPRGPSRLRLMVPQRYLVYARWVAHAAGLDTWPDDQTAEDRGIDQREAA